MRTPARVGLWGVAVVALITAAAIGIGRYTFDRRVGGEIDDALSIDANESAGDVCEERVAALPVPVQRWLRWSGTVGRPIPSTVRLRQEGECRLCDRGWFPFTAEEYYSTRPPAFVWKATIRMTPGVEVVGKDSYLDGRGTCTGGPGPAA